MYAPYQAIVYRIVIGSPSDVEPERERARSVINSWNEQHSVAMGVVLLPVMWELHATPELGEGPQPIVNRQLIDSGDVLVCIFWSRIGTPTASAESGTLDEIQRFRRSGKPVMIYFSNRRIPQPLDTRQWKRLQAFKSRIQKEGVVATFNSINDFTRKLERHLMNRVRRLRRVPGSSDL